MKKIILPALLVWFASDLAGFAQMGPSSPPGVSAALTKLFGTTTAFTAKCDVRVLDKNQKEKMSLPMDFAALDGKFRAEIDMARMKGQELGAETAAQMKQMGMDRIVSVMRPDKKALYLIYPGLQSYVNMPMPKEDTEALEKEPKIEKTVLGKETLDGHACEKTKVIITDANGRQSEALIWTAKDLKDFPIQIQTTEKNDTVILRYKNVQFTKPDAKQFEPPAGYTAYNDMQSFMTGMMQKMMSGAGQP